MLEGDTDRGSGAGSSGISVSYDRCAAVCSGYGGIRLLRSGAGGGRQMAGSAGIYGGRYLRNRRSASADEYRIHPWQSMRSGRKQLCSKGSANRKRAEDRRYQCAGAAHDLPGTECDRDIFAKDYIFAKGLCTGMDRERRNISCRRKHRHKRGRKNGLCSGDRGGLPYRPVLYASEIIHS